MMFHVTVQIAQTYGTTNDKRVLTIHIIDHLR